MRLVQTVLKIFLPLLAVSAGIVAFALFYPISLPKNGSTFYVPAGVSRANVVADLNQHNFIRLTPLFDFYTVLRGKPPRAGEYLFAKGSSPFKMWSQITSGTGRYYRAFTIIPGTTFKQIKLALQKDTTFKHLIQDAGMNDQDIMDVMGDGKRAPEGMFMPETYYYSRGDADLVILKRAYDLLQLKLDEAWNGRAANLPFKDAYEALIAASLVEKEAYLAREQPLIAGVLVNRLEKNMLLQFDPTIIYGLGDAYRGKIYKNDLTTDTPYNSYLHKGLPPTPIAMPSLTAIHAAVHPARHDYLYFVATGDGSHAFTSNLQDHNTAVMRARQTVQTPVSPTGAANAPG
jgi:UPF0755 protein